LNNNVCLGRTFFATGGRTGNRVVSYGVLRSVTATEMTNGRLEARTDRSARAVPKRVAMIRISPGRSRPSRTPGTCSR
jgi:hypothetical protein